MSCSNLPVRFKVGLNRGRRRIWLDGPRLTAAGFAGGSYYHCLVQRGSIVAILLSAEELHERDPLVPPPAGTVIKRRKVTGRADGKPVIDISGSDVSLAVGQAPAVNVVFARGRIVITPTD